MLSKRDLLLGSASGVAALSFADALFAQGEQLQLFVPAAPGGGWDQTARMMEQVLRAEKLLSGVQITNVAGAGGAVGLPQFVNQWKGRPNALMVSGMVMVGALLANKSPVKLAQTTPVARLTGELEVLVVPANSPIRTGKDFAEALKADPKKISVAGGSAGGTDHILFGMIGKALGIAPSQLAYVAYSGGGPAVAAIIGGHVAAGISGLGEFGEHIKAGKLRAVAVSGAERHANAPDIPTLKEQGIDVELFNWRGVFAPPGTSPDARGAMISLMERMSATATWSEQCAKRDWTPMLLTGDAYAKFLADETARVEAILKDLGLAT
ncbi:MAG: putative tricarboxylic transport rane protein [Variibacter sp.]|jgi:putative tricarboxylic transport membrane protein|nr:putative tricarboxylic transport rane protein [Variibacter sp.]